MESAILPFVPTLPQMLGQMGILVTALYVLLAISLTIWVGLLMLRTRALSNYCAYIGATLVPLLFGIMGGISSTLRLSTLISVYGIMPGIDGDVAATFEIQRILFQLYSGCLLTSIFFPLGILALLIRRPK